MENYTRLLDALNMPLSKIENEISISNGLLGKIKKGDRNLSDDVWSRLNIFYEKTFGEKFSVTEKANTPFMDQVKAAKEKLLNKMPEPDAGKLKTVRATIEKINKDFGEGTIRLLGDSPMENVEVVSTGSMTLDSALGVGGLPKGRLIEFYGEAGSGKTTLAMHVIKEAQKHGDLCAFIDAEHSFDVDYAERIGIDMDRLSINQPDNGEQALEIADRMICSGSIGVIVIDSVAALVPKAELEGEMGDSRMGLQARLMSQACRKMTASIGKTKTICIFINQLREKIGIVYGNPFVTSGGNALKFYSSVRLEVKRDAPIKDGDLQIGNKTKVRVMKNKVASPFGLAEFDLIFGKGIDTVGELVDLGSLKDIIQKNGSWYAYNGTKLGQGRDTVIGILNDNPELLQEIEKQIKEAAMRAE